MVSVGSNLGRFYDLRAPQDRDSLRDFAEHAAESFPDIPSIPESIRMANAQKYNKAVVMHGALRRALWLMLEHTSKKS